MFDNSKKFYTFVTDQNENIMTDYEKLIKEARTLEGMYYEGKKIVQGVAYRDCLGGAAFVFQDDEDDIIYSSEDYMSFDEVLEALNKLDEIKKECYKPLIKVFTFTSDSKHIEECKRHRDSCYFLQSLNKDIEISIAFTDEDITPIEEIHEEIRKILNQKKDSKK